MPYRFYKYNQVIFNQHKKEISMKKLILFLAVLIPVILSAQTEVVTEEKAFTDDQTNEWMNKISSDSEMRSQMMDMMIDKIRGNKEEMMKLVNSFTADAEIKKMVTEKTSKRASGEYSLQPREMMSDTIKVMQMKQTKPMPK
jgi:hypothetical protein